MAILERTPAETALIDAFAAAQTRLPGGRAAQALRQSAFETFEAAGLPSRRVEAWHYTDLRAQLRDVPPFFAADGAGLAAGVPFLAGAARLTLANGGLQPVKALPAGVTVTPLATALAEARPDILAALAGPELARGDVALALNALFMTDGVVIEVAAGTKVATPIEIQYRVAGAARSVATRSVLILGDGAELGLIETVEAGPEHQVHDALNVVAGKGSRLQHVRVAARDCANLSLSTLTATLGEAARVETFTLGTGAALTRRQYFVAVGGDDAHLRIDGVNLLSGSSHSDTTLTVEHDCLRSESRELVRSVVRDGARGVFQGKVIVKPHAQKTDGRMASNALLLGPRAEMSNKPELEIFADDVLCAHGATCGEIDERQLFYLLSRGIPRREAEALLVRAFVAEVVELIGAEGGPLVSQAEALHGALEAEIDALLERR
jgi:Fe-S cluster assembly protein SufD